MQNFIRACTTVMAFAASFNAHADLSPAETKTACLELGLTPETTTALGLSAFEASAMLGRIAESDLEIEQLRTLQQQHRQIQVDLKDAMKAVRVASTNSEASQLENQIGALEQSSVSIAAQIESLQDQIRTYGLTESVDPVLAERVCEPEGLMAAIPPEYRLVNLNDDDLAELLPALAAEQLTLSNDEPLDTDAQQVLSRFQNLPAVLAARSHMLTHLDSVRTAFGL